MTDQADNDGFQPARARLAAGALFSDQGGRLLLVKPTYKDSWEIPGGYVEPGESPRAACVREVREELGINPPIGELLATDWAPHPADGDKILFVFDGGCLPDHEIEQIRVRAGEIDRFAFHDVDRVSDVLIPRLARRVLAAVRARRTGRPVYLEHGEQP
jgi:8-oxo-dGTP diphosphatase